MTSDLLIAVVADVHGNRWALEAVLADVERRGVDRVVNLGDSLYGPLDPAGAALLLMQQDVLSIRGNQDRVLVEPPAELLAHPTYRFVQAQLRDEHRRWLAAQATHAVVYDELRLCHGTPDADDVYLLEEVHPAGVQLRPPAALAELLSGVRERVLLCAHSHVPRAVWSGERWVVNPGSVGLPAYTDDAPYPHAMEAGSPHARYALLRRKAGQWQVEHVAVAYDWTAAARCAAEHGRADWAAWLRAGRA
jgi:predicted phosphodiesterase